MDETGEYIIKKGAYKVNYMKRKCVCPNQTQRKGMGNIFTMIISSKDKQDLEISCP